MKKRNIEIETALNIIELLKQYELAETQNEKNMILQQIAEVDVFAHYFLVNNYLTPGELIKKIAKALELDEYRPKNMSIILFAVMNTDLDYINGEFDTFDRKLSQMVSNKEDPAKIRKSFELGITNVNMLAKQFSADWIHRLNNHKYLVYMARNASKAKAVRAYQRLFDALTNDFCQEYGCSIKTKVVTDWAECPIKPKKMLDRIRGFNIAYYKQTVPPGISQTEEEKLYKGIEKNPNSSKGAEIVVNIENTRRLCPEPTEFFYEMIRVYVHEMHHALDFLCPRQGALGSQIYDADSRIYVNDNEKDNLASATEISSHIIDEYLVNQLKNRRF